MKRDYNKDIGSIAYNHLNLPVKLTFGNGDTIEYLYDATGMKLKKTYTSAADLPHNTDYLWGYQYLDDVLQFFPTSEGHVKNTVYDTGSSLNYVFTFKDQLGNNRVSYGMDPSENVLKIMEDNGYYPFGMRHEGYNWTYRTYLNYQGNMTINVPPSYVGDGVFTYKFNSKEWQDELGLGLYDYGARNYDPAVGRFFSVDRMSEMFMNLTPYQYAGNNPVFFIDVNGEYIYINDDKSGVNYRYQQGSTQKQVDGEWVNVGENDYLSDFVVCTIANLNNLGTSGGTGAGLIDKFSGADRDVTFQYRNIDNGGNEAVFAGQNSVTGTHVDVNTIFFDNKVSASAFTTAGYLATPDFVTIGHEMAHLTGPREIQGLNAPWLVIKGQAISKSEIRASHYENLIRQEAGLPLRTYYGESINRLTGKPEPLAPTRLIDRAGNSIYYSHDPTRMAPGSIPTLIQEGLNVSKRPLTGRYNYYERQ